MDEKKPKGGTCVGVDREAFARLHLELLRSRTLALETALANRPPSRREPPARPTPAPCPPCVHPEAFCLMAYGTGVGRVTIWNARDGVTPFYIDEERKHEDWGGDFCHPWHQPAIGSLVFVDLTLERATEHRRRYVERYWEKDLGAFTRMCDRYATKEVAIAELAAGDLDFGGGGAPDLLTLEDGWQVVAVCAAARQQAEALGVERPRIRRFA